MTTEEIIDLEERYQIPTYNKMPIALERGRGSYVWDVEGNKYLDFYGGHCVTLLGHCPERVVEAVTAQAKQLIFYSNSTYNPLRAEAAEQLAGFAPEGMKNIFFANSGSEANETALKLARTWTGKTGVIAMKGGFHGRTLGSLATTWGEKYRGPYTSILSETQFLPFGDAAALARALEHNADTAAVILEPIQSIAGVREAPQTFYRKLRTLCNRHNVALIFDEVQTGVGRTGTFSIAEQYEMTPDLISLAKSLGSGVPVSAVLTSDAIADTVEYGDQGSTFGGGMMAMAALKATLTTIEDDGLLARAGEIHERIRSGLSPMVREVRGRGCLIGVELDTSAKPVAERLRNAGVLVGTAAPDDTLRVMPPLNASDDEADTFLERFEEVVNVTPQE
jgi:acetylornithine/succinyldiaminopimelate/putrescine aminotransferase